MSIWGHMAWYFGGVAAAMGLASILTRFWK